MKRHKYTANYTVERNDESIQLEIEGTYNPGEPEVRYYRDGSGHPGSPAYFDDIISTTHPDIELTEEEMEDAQECLFDAFRDEQGPQD